MEKKRFVVDGWHQPTLSIAVLGHIYLAFSSLVIFVCEFSRILPDANRIERLVTDRKAMGELKRRFIFLSHDDALSLDLFLASWRCAAPNKRDKNYSKIFR